MTRARKAPVLTEPGQLLKGKRLPRAGKAQASNSDRSVGRTSPRLSIRSAGSWVYYWVLQSPSLLWAVFTFFSSFCSSDSATRTSLGLWYCGWSQGEGMIQSYYPHHTHTHIPCPHAQDPFFPPLFKDEAIEAYRVE